MLCVKKSRVVSITMDNSEKGETESFPKPSSKDELRAFDDQIFVTGTRSVQVSLKKVSRTRSIPDLSTLRKKSKAPCRPKFFDRLLNTVKLAKKSRSSSTLSSPPKLYGSSFDEDEEADTFIKENVVSQNSIEEITQLDVDGFQLHLLEEGIKNKELLSQTSDENLHESSKKFKRKSKEKRSSKSRNSDKTVKEEEKSFPDNRNSDSSEKSVKQSENSDSSEKSIKQSENSDSSEKSVKQSENKIETETDICSEGNQRERSLSEESYTTPHKTFERSLSTESSTQSTPSSPQTTGIVRDRLERFRRLNERGNRDPRIRRSMSVPNSPDLKRMNISTSDEHCILFKKVEDKFKKVPNMSEEDPDPYGGVKVQPGYVKALVSQINKNKTNKTEGLSLLSENENKIIDSKNVNGDCNSIQSDVSHTTFNNESASSSNRNSLKSSDCGGTSDTTSSGQDKTENESGFVSEGICMDAEKLFDSSWSESDEDFMSDSDDESVKPDETSSPTTESDDKGFTDSTEVSGPPKDKIQQIVEELLSTEKAYVERLKLLDQTFQFRVVQENKIHNFLPDGVIPQMFSNVQSIYQFHNDFLLPQIKERVEKWSPESKIGDMMKQYAPLLKMYTEYVKNFDNAMNLITVWSEKSPKFASIIKEIQMTPECGSLTLQHHMLGPVQRIPRYEMLLKDYLRRLPEDAADREDAQVALELVTTAACHSNEAMKKIDSFNKLLEIMRKIDTSENLISPTRELVREGRIIKISARGGERLERFLFLFNDLMLICFEPLLGSYKIKSQLEMDGMEIMERTDKCLRWILEGESIDIPNTFYVKSRQKIIQFLDENSNGEPSGWCETIRKTIEKYKRRQSSKSTEIQRNSKGMTDVELGKVAPKWIKDDEVTMCMKCTAKFTAIRRRHHCRACGDVVCGRCSSKKVPLRYDNNHLNRVCDDCYHLLRNDEEEPVTPTHDKSSKKKNILQINASDPSVLSGYLHLSTDKGKSWHRRWVAVHHNFVMYTFKAHQDPYAITSLPLPGHVVEDVDKVEHLDRENLFKISHKRTNLYLSSETTTSKERWMFVLSKVVMAEIPEDVEDISKRDSSHSSSSNEFYENTESEQSHL
ncbi:FYVE, RhoGEF and PH domain-containing protein 1,FYVE, RhoGEF and PH domain-containing protein 4 [Mytilus coruscus]|uniref:FYVE, RhoGEF and PH domain-containing protein 1,FYVE, RhoGEF and PH domain-containing protein 4 n=1 Tax=Mytilus coruscus TaxID=42192 RepID=A0A6J8CPX9_MYTCO|nr:FYVE, RhoGEF and PH domain-containing protein 1,FYVE, RhoGEF and PH domain-containing protein 4 [Mytilus coruscus]